MKNAIEAALELTAQQEATKPLEYEEACKIALASGRTVIEVQQEHARKAVPIAPLAKALEAQAAVQVQGQKAAAAVEEALSIQAEFEQLLERRALLRAINIRGQQMFNESLAAVEAGKLSWLSWHVMERDSPIGQQAVYQFVSGHIMHERIVAWFPDWQNHLSGQIHQTEEKITAFEARYRLKR